MEQCWLEIPRHFPDVELDAFVVMPNHVHGIIVISVAEDVGAKNLSPVQDDAGGVGAKDFSPRRSPSRTIGSIVRGFKIGVTKWFRQNTDISVVWQRNYYEHIIRNGESMNTIQEYITGNPAQWDWDRENLAPARRVAPVAGNEPWRV